MAGPLRLSIEITGSSAGLKPATGDARRQITEVGGAADAASRSASAMGATFEAAGRTIVATTATAADRVRQLKATLEAASAVRVDGMGMAISGASAEVAGAQAAMGSALRDLRAQFDPTTAATLHYEAALGDLREAHRLGAVDGALLVRREAELKAAYERTTAAIAGRDAAAKRSVETSVARQTIVPDRGADIAAYGAELDALRAKYNPLWAAEQAHLAALEEIARAERVGAISADEAAAAVSRATGVHAAQIDALRRAEAGLRGHAGAMKLSATQATQLSYQLNDVVVSLMSGMNPLTVMIQQGSQITPIYGGVGATFRALGAALNPATLGIAAAALATGAATKAAIDWSNSMRAADTVARGVGRGAGTTAAEIDAIARSSASAGGVSVVSAREMATEFARTGRIGVDQFGTLIGIAKDFGATIGQDASTAAKTLATAISDPAKGAQQLAESFNLLDSAQVRVITRMVEQGRVAEAQALLTDAIRVRMVPAGETVAWYARKWDELKRSVSDYYDAAGRGLAATRGPEERLSALDAEAKRLEARAQSSGDAEARNFFGGAAKQRATRAAEIRKQIAEEKAVRDRLAAEAVADRQGKAALELAAGSGSSAVRDQLARQKLTDEIAQMKAGQAARNLTAEEDRRIATALEAKTRALTTWISESDRARRLAELDLAVQATRDPVERAALERRRALVTLAGQEVTAAEAAAAAETAHARALGEVSAAARGSLADMTADVAARTRVNALVAAGALSLADVNRELEIEAQTRQLVALAARAEGAEREKTLTLIEQTTRAITARADADRRAAALQEIRSGDDRLETLRLEIALVGRSEAVRARNLALLEAEQKIRSQGWSGAEAEQIRARAVAAADLNTALERQKSAWDEIRSAGGSAIDTIVDGLRQGKVDASSLLQDLQKEAFKLALANPLKNALFGQNLPGLGDVGGLLGAVLGNKSAAVAAVPGLSSVGAMQVTAGTVMINGGVAGATGLVGSLGGLGGLDRSGFAAELTPAIRAKLFAMTEAEVGGQGSSAQQAFMESVFNRAAARGKSLDQILSDRGYFPAETFDRAGAVMGSSRLDTKYGSLFDQVRAGSNVSSFATGNASGSVGFGGGPLTATFGGEKFGIEKSDMSWATGLKASAGDASTSLTSLGSSSTSAVGALGQLSSGTSQATSALAQSSGSLAQSAAGIGSSAGGLETASKQAATSATGAFGTLFGALGQGIDGLIGGLGKLVGGLGGGGGGGLFSWIGGLFGGKADGGLIRGPGSGTSDSILGAYPAGTYIVNAASTGAHRSLLEAIASGAANDVVPTWVSNGEFAIAPDVAQRHLPLLEAINRGALPRRAGGGSIDGARIGRMPQIASGGGGSSRRAGNAGGAAISMPMTFHFTDVSPDVEARMQAAFEQRVPSIVSQAVTQVAEVRRTQSGYLG